jgi:hypothetical protein
MLKVIIKILSTFVFTMLILWLFIGCFAYEKSNTFYYYDDISVAMEDANNKTVGKHSSHIGTISVMKSEKKIFVELLDDIELKSQLIIDNANINLNNFTINSNGFEITTYKNVTIKNGNINITGNKDCISGIIIGRKSSCSIDNVNITTTCENGKNFSILAYGKLLLDNSTVRAYNTGEKINRVAAVYGNLFSEIEINNCDIIALSEFGIVYGVYIGDNGIISNSKIVATSNYDSTSSGYTSFSTGCMLDGPTTLIDCNIYGIHSGVNSNSYLIINGGTYSGFGHGGVYFSGYNKTSYVRNATIQEVDIIDGYQTFGPQATHGGCYIGGGKDQSQLQVFMDNCILIGQKYGVVLRGTDGEQNNTLYISNSVLDKNVVRIDNDSHQLFIGSGCNIDKSNATISDVVTVTNNTYN